MARHALRIQLNALILLVLTVGTVAPLAIGQTCVDGGACNPSSLNNVINVDGVTYPCSTTGIQGALAALPPNGGIVDASGCPSGGSVPITSTIYVGSNSQNVVLRLGPGTYTGSVSPLFFVHERSRLTIPMGTVVQESSLSATGIILAGGASPTGALVGGIDGTGLVLGPGSGTGSIGLLLGGTSISPNAPGNAANYVEVGAISITNFGTGEEYGNHVYIVDHQKTAIYGNGTSVSLPSSLTECCENIAYHGSLFGAASGVAMPSNFVISGGGLDLTLDSCSLDQADLVINAASPSVVRVYGGHFEKPQASSSDYIQMSGNHFVELHGVLVVEDQPSARTEFFSDNGGHLRIFGGDYLAAQNTQQLVTATSPGTVEIYGPNGNNFLSEINSTFTGGYIISGSFIFGIGSPGEIKTNANISTTGSITGGSKYFKIDDPLDPSKKYLNYNSVESPEMATFYDGIVTLDAHGEQWVRLPDYFEALNRDFRYQLTAIGSSATGLYIAEEISNNKFKIAGGKPNMKVSWQVTGLRHDAYATAHPTRVVEEKAENEQGHYLHPELYQTTGQSTLKSGRQPK